MTLRKNSAKAKITAADLKGALTENQDLLKAIVEEVLQQVLEAEMDEVLQAGKGDAQRVGWATDREFTVEHW